MDQDSLRNQPLLQPKQEQEVKAGQEANQKASSPVFLLQLVCLPLAPPIGRR